MRITLVVGIGAVFTVLLLVLPAFHLAQWSGGAVPPELAALSALPVVVLLIAAFRPSTGPLLLAFPVAHLPALLAEPQLTERAGPVTLGVVAAVGAAWYVVVLWAPARTSWAPAPEVLDPHRVSPGGRVLTAATLLLSVAVFTAFASAALVEGVDPLAANLTLLCGVAVTWHAVGRAFGKRLGDILYERRRPGRLGDTGRRVLVSLLAVKRPSRSELWGTAVLLLLAASVLTVWYALGALSGE